MTKKTEQQDPLLEGDENEGAKAPASAEADKKPEAEPEPAKTKAETVAPAPKAPGNSLKAEAIAKFPKDIVAQTQYILEKSEQVSFMLPLGENEKPGTIEEPQINGFKTKVPKGVMVMIPIQVANLLAEKYKIAMTAGQSKRIDRASDVSDALNG